MSGRIVVEMPSYAEIEAAIYAPGGPAERHLRSACRKIERIAKSLVNKRSGTLRNSINYHIERRGPMPVGIVGAYAPHAYLVHEGSSPHLITPDGGHVLRFTGSRGVTMTPYVHHPGYKGNPFLVKALRAVTRPIT